MLLVMGFTGKAAMKMKIAYINAFDSMYEYINNMRLSYEAERNAVMLEFMKEKDVASMSGRLLNRWGRQKKPALLARIKKLNDDGQLKLIIQGTLRSLFYYIEEIDMKRNYTAMVFVIAMAIIVFTAIGVEYGIVKAAEYVVVSAISVVVTCMLFYINKRKH